MITNEAIKLVLLDTSNKLIIVTANIILIYLINNFKYLLHTVMS